MKLDSLTDYQLVQDFLVAATPAAGAESLASGQWSALLRVEGTDAALTGVIADDGRTLAIFNLIKTRLLGRWFYYYLPRGPIFAAGLASEEQAAVWHFLRSEFRRRHALFFRVEPVLAPLEKINAVKTHDLQPQETFLLDLTKTEEDLLAACHQKTRYNIRLAEKKGVTVREGHGEADFQSFWHLMMATGKRDGFRIHGRQHYQNLATQNPEFIKLFLAEHDGQVVAAGLFSFFGDKAIYLHGASDHGARSLMAPYLLQWTVIKFARQAGYRLYDFYGINETKWPGVTRFKLGFGGFRFSYAGAYDVILSADRYYLYLGLKKLRRLL